MAELATIARPYAEALFRVAQKGDLAVWSKLVEELAQVAAVPEVLSLSRNPRVTRSRVTDLLLNAVQAPIDENAKNLVRLVVDNHRLDVLPEIATQFELLKNEREGAADVSIASAFPLDGSELDSLVASLEKKFKRKLKAHVTVDPSLIGGVRVTVGDEVLDTSVRAQLSRMQTALTA